MHHLSNSFNSCGMFFFYREQFVPVKKTAKSRKNVIGI